MNEEGVGVYGLESVCVDPHRVLSGQYGGHIEWNIEMSTDSGGSPETVHYGVVGGQRT